MNNARLNMTIVGTSAWMAPEVFTREGYTVQADGKQSLEDSIGDSMVPL
jgi:hypothetical protein